MTLPYQFCRAIETACGEHPAVTCIEKRFNGCKNPAKDWILRLALLY